MSQTLADPKPAAIISHDKHYSKLQEPIRSSSVTKRNFQSSAVEQEEKNIRKVVLNQPGFGRRKVKVKRKEQLTIADELDQLPSDSNVQVQKAFIKLVSTVAPRPFTKIETTTTTVTTESPKTTSTTTRERLLPQRSNVKSKGKKRTVVRRLPIRPNREPAAEKAKENVQSPTAPSQEQTGTPVKPKDKMKTRMRITDSLLSRVQGKFKVRSTTVPPRTTTEGSAESVIKNDIRMLRRNRIKNALERAALSSTPKPVTPASVVTPSLSSIRSTTSKANSDPTRPRSTTSSTSSVTSTQPSNSTTTVTTSTNPSASTSLTTTTTKPAVKRKIKITKKPKTIRRLRTTASTTVSTTTTTKTTTSTTTVSSSTTAGPRATERIVIKKRIRQKPTSTLRPKTTTETTTSTTQSTTSSSPTLTSKRPTTRAPKLKPDTGNDQIIDSVAKKHESDLQKTVEKEESERKVAENVKDDELSKDLGLEVEKSVQRPSSNLTVASSKMSGLRKELLAAIRRKVMKNKTPSTTIKPSDVKKLPYETIVKTEPENNDRREHLNSFNDILPKPVPPRFGPHLPYSGQHQHHPQPRNPSQPRVQFFLRVPNEKQRPNIKIPNISHIQGKIARLNYAISEGLANKRKEEIDRRRIPIPKPVRVDSSFAETESPKIDKKVEGTTNSKGLVDEIEDLAQSEYDSTKKVLQEVKTEVEELITSKPKESLSTIPKSHVSKTTLSTTSSTATTTSKLPTTTSDPVVTSTDSRIVTRVVSRVAELPVSTTPSTTSSTTSTTTTTSKASTTSSTSTSPRPTTRITTTMQEIVPTSSQDFFQDSDIDFKITPNENLQVANPAKSDSSLHPTSHFRPKNETNLKSNNKEDVRVVKPVFGDFEPSSKNQSVIGNAQESQDIIHDVSGTTFYVIGVICVIPAAGLVAWVVRYVIKKKVRKFSNYILKISRLCLNLL